MEGTHHRKKHHSKQSTCSEVPLIVTPYTNNSIDPNDLTTFSFEHAAWQFCADADSVKKEIIVLRCLPFNPKGLRLPSGNEKTSSNSIDESGRTRQKIKCIEKDLKGLYCYLKDLKKTHGMPLELPQYMSVLCRLQDIRDAFRDLKDGMRADNEDTTSKKKKCSCFPCCKKKKGGDAKKPDKYNVEYSVKCIAEAPKSCKDSCPCPCPSVNEGNMFNEPSKKPCPEICTIKICKKEDCESAPKDPCKKELTCEPPPCCKQEPQIDICCSKPEPKCEPPPCCKQEPQIDICCCKPEPKCEPPPCCKQEPQIDICCCKPEPKREPPPCCKQEPQIDICCCKPEPKREPPPCCKQEPEIKICCCKPEPICEPPPCKSKPKCCCSACQDAKPCCSAAADKDPCAMQRAAEILEKISQRKPKIRICCNCRAAVNDSWANKIDQNTECEDLTARKPKCTCCNQGCQTETPIISHYSGGIQTKKSNQKFSSKKQNPQIRRRPDKNTNKKSNKRTKDLPEIQISTSFPGKANLKYEATDGMYCKNCFGSAVPTIDANLGAELKKIVGQRSEMVFLKISSVGECLFHIEVSTGGKRNLGCLFVTDKAMKEARKNKTFKSYVTLGIAHSSAWLPTVKNFVDYPFEFCDR